MDAPALRELGEGGLAIHLGEHEARRWFLVVADTAKRSHSVEGRVRDDLLFLAGECAGLLFFRRFAGEVDTPEEDG